MNFTIYDSNLVGDTKKETTSSSDKNLMTLYVYEILQIHDD